MVRLGGRSVWKGIVLESPEVPRQSPKADCPTGRVPAMWVILTEIGIARKWDIPAISRILVVIPIAKFFLDCSNCCTMNFWPVPHPKSIVIPPNKQSHQDVDCITIQLAWFADLVLLPQIPSLFPHSRYTQSRIIAFCHLIVKHFIVCGRSWARRG